MTDNVESLLPRLLAEIRDAIKEGFADLGAKAAANQERLTSIDLRLFQVDATLSSMDTKLSSMDTKLSSMDTKLDRIDRNTRATRDHVGTLIGVLDHGLADQMADVRHRLSVIEDRLDIRR